MGKSNRIRANRAEREVMTLSEKKQKKGMPSWLMTLIAVVLTLAILLSVVGLLLASNGVFNRWAKTLSTEHFKVNANMLSYYYYTEYQNFLSDNQNSLTYYSLDTSKSLKDQRFGGPEETNPDEPTFYYDSMLGDFEGTWFDYFMDKTVTSVSSLLVYCEGAYELGIELEEADYEQLDATLTTMATTAATYGYTNVDSYISAVYGSGVKEKDVKKAMEYSFLANKAMTELSGSLLDKITDEDIDEKYESDTQKFLLVDYSYYTFSATYADAKKQAELSDVADSDLTADQKKKIADKYSELIGKAKENVAKIEAMSSITEVNEFIIGYAASEEVDKAWNMQTIDVGDNTTAVKAAIVGEIKTEVLAGETKGASIKDNAIIKTYELSDSVLGQLETVKNTAFSEVTSDKDVYLREKVGFVSETDKVSSWAFADGAKVGDTKVVTEGDEEAEVKSGVSYSSSVYFLAKTPYRDEEKTKNIAYMLFTDETAAKAAVQAMMDRDISELADFEALAEEFSASANTHMEDYVKGSLQSDIFDTWLFSNDVTVGSYTEAPLKLEDGSTYCVALYYGDGNETWYVTVKNQILTEQFDETVKTWTETYQVEIKEKALDRVDA